MTILEELYQLCDSCHGDMPKADTVDGVCRWCRAKCACVTSIVNGAEVTELCDVHARWDLTNEELERRNGGDQA